MKIYGISGLGADERVFDQVNRYLDHKIEFVPWLEPEPKESLRHYALRMAGTLDTQAPFSLVGVSFGGMIATEMRKVIHPQRTVIVSSAACRKELPIYFRGVGRLNLVPYIPNSFINVPRPLINVITSIKDEAQADLVYDIMQKSRPEFIKWAVQSILTLDNDEVPEGLRRIHGKADRLLPLKAKSADLIEGGHMVIVEKPEEMARLIKKELS